MTEQGAREKRWRLSVTSDGHTTPIDINAPQFVRVTIHDVRGAVWRLEREEADHDRLA